MRPVGYTDVLAWDPEARERVLAALMERDQKRRQRATWMASATPPEFTEVLDSIRVRMAKARQQIVARRSGHAHVALVPSAIAMLEHAIAREQTRFIHYNDDADIGAPLALLRANYVCDKRVVDGELFRRGARQLWERLFERALHFAIPTLYLPRRLPKVATQLVVVLPWRAALIAGEVCKHAGVEHFWHLGCSRDEQTLACSVYHEHRAPAHTHSYLHIIAEPMLAAGGTLIEIIERLRTSDVPLNKIVIVCAVAAPEGADRILHTYPEVRLVCGALDGHLDEKGYIAEPGLGDFGDRAMEGVDGRYAEAHWISTGLLTKQQAEIVLSR
ncbi:MAG: uracil phosphoribosyltransferase [bacterium]|nr:uracil phosphoribosyltransferase [bacterium]